ncbi:MAG TPA: XdhC/CoxI family protein [Gemmatimonadales bacterium]|jgi:xanthine dehydrogenase accessory factor|nr:XdhC/CoxI family protein [Gemmatimonadales bacterium]
MNVWRAAADLVRAGTSGALATVAQVRGSTPVPAGTKMLVGSEGRLIGTVGGGCVEADVIGAALDAQTRRRPAIVTHHLNADLAGDLGLSCGGTVDIFVEPLVADEAYVRVLEAAAAAEGEGGGLVRTGVTWEAGPVKSFEPLPPNALTGVPAMLTRDGKFVVERVTRPPRLVVFGAGHVGSAIARAAAAAGFRVVVVDDRAEYADPRRFTDGIAVLAGEVDAALTRYPLTAADAVVIATRGHRNDALILERIATSLAGYVGLLGSRRKKAVVTKGLTAGGVPGAALKRVRVPVGLAIGAVTPEEIAVSVVAELIAWRRG